MDEEKSAKRVFDLETWLRFEEVLDPGWLAALRPVRGELRKIGEMLAAETAAGRGFAPDASNVLRVFRYPFDDVKVLLVGQDPYPTPGDAVGLSFAVSKDRALPPSLRNIYRELQDDLGCAPPSSGDLSPWAEQGVCLLNRVLTVSPGSATSHRGRGWESITEQAIRALVARQKPLVAILWGREAATLEPLLGASPVVKSPHPSPLSAYRGFFGSRPFSRTNDLLKTLGETPINWTSEEARADHESRAGQESRANQE